MDWQLNPLGIALPIGLNRISWKLLLADLYIYYIQPYRLG